MKILPLIVTSLLLGACAAPQNIAVSSDSLLSMRGKSLVLIQRESPSFVAMTSGKGMFAVAGVGAAVAAGNKMVDENRIVDPAMGISREVADNLVARYDLRVQGETGIADSDSLTEIAALAEGSDFALDVVTSGWTYIYDGFNFDDYFVGYSSELRLIEVTTGEVVSSGFCGYNAKEAGKGPVAHDTLLADNAAYIKQELADAAAVCVQEFTTNLFSAPAVASTRGNN